MQTTDTQRDKIGIFCPTRKRTQSLARLMESILNNANHPERVHFAFYVDDDDVVTLDFLDNVKKNFPVNIVVVKEPHNARPLSDTYNVLYKNCAVDIMMQFGDDTVMRTKGWDTLVEETFRKFDDRLALVYGRDGIHNEGFAPHYALHRNWIDALGYASPPYFTVDWSDTWTFEIAKALNRHVFLPDLLIEHLHWTQGKSPIDETTYIAEMRRRSTNNEEIFRSERMVNERLDAVKKLKERMNESQA
jgi:hypothetical protein